MALDHAHYLRLSFAVALRARANGNHPFGAILVGPDGAVLMEAENTVTTTRDRTGHAERNLMTRASMLYDAAFLAGCTLYTSTEPCAMCAASAYWAGIGTVVYGLAETTLGTMIGSNPENLTLTLDCRKVLGAGQRPVAVIGPSLELEAKRVHEGFWP